MERPERTTPASGRLEQGSFSVLAGDNLVMGSKTKTCSRCGKKKRLDAFYKQEGGAQERRGRCKECYRAAQREAWARDPQVQARRREILKRWRAEGL
jgi:hypothetical protein